jgi:putative endonuclease
MAIGTSNANSTGRKSAARRRASSAPIRLSESAHAGESARTPRRVLGDSAEDQAVVLLERHDFRILTRNFHCRAGELDIVARLDNLLVIAEVRTRSSERFGGAAASVDTAKQRKIILATQRLLQRSPALRRCRVRFDVMVVRDGVVEWLQAAFGA